ncbi:LysR family transcriptional regulator [Alteribacillus iranensis]|uniref:DNA-binding transcriptional regulator, LysR family n=1 Tax=Alteribacillus iranensis TaxID=930128 RepID=A0A1I2DRW4_9BACI|nr:LysR family transcriptional regulator [Alteribacillus iranensis]SFE82660.1 DNA-binding transcriptional regulator, LysR family [Alteribacillus iranensis]
MNIQTFQLFCYAVEEKSISGAAKRAFLSQPAATKKIRQLEEHYSTSLFERDYTPLLLTAAGKRLYHYAKAMIENYHDSVEAISNIRNEGTHSLNIGSSYTLGEYVLPEIISAFQQKQPSTHLQLSISNTPTILSDLENRKIEIAFVEGGITNQELNKRVIAYDDIILIVAPGHPWAGKQIVPNNLTQDRLIRRESNSATRQIIEDHLAKRLNTGRIKQTLELGTTQAIKSAVQSGLGYGFVSRLAVRQELRVGLLSEVQVSSIQIQRPLWTASRIQRFPKDSIGQFTAFVEYFLKSETS